MEYNTKVFNHYIEVYKTGDKMLLELLDSRKLYCCLYNDSKLDDEKKYYKSKIDLLDSQINFISLGQTLMIQCKHNLIT